MGNAFLYGQGGASVVDQTTLPPQVTNLSISQVSANSVGLSWFMSNSALLGGYLLVCKTGSYPTGIEDGEKTFMIPKSEVFFNATGLEPETTYYFRIFPYSNTGVYQDYYHSSVISKKTTVATVQLRFNGTTGTIVGNYAKGSQVTVYSLSYGSEGNANFQSYTVRIYSSSGTFLQTFSGSEDWSTGMLRGKATITIPANSTDVIYYTETLTVEEGM